MRVMEMMKENYSRPETESRGFKCMQKGHWVSHASDSAPRIHNVSYSPTSGTPPFMDSSTFLSPRYLSPCTPIKSLRPLSS